MAFSRQNLQNFKPSTWNLVQPLSAPKRRSNPWAMAAGVLAIDSAVGAWLPLSEGHFPGWTYPAFNLCYSVPLAFLGGLSFLGILTAMMGPGRQPPA